MKNLVSIKPDLGVTATKDGRAVVSTRDVAEIFNKRHDNVLQDVGSLDCSPEFTALNFQESKYKDSSGK